MLFTTSTLPSTKEHIVLPTINVLGYGQSYYSSPPSTTINMSYAVLLGVPALQPIFSFLFIITVSISKLASFLELDQIPAGWTTSTL